MPGEVVVLDRPEYFLNDVSSTFHGRDIFAPVAGHLSTGTASLRDLGSPAPVDSLTALPWAPILDTPNQVHAPVVSIDRFGNCRTLIARRHLTADPASIYVRCGDVTIRGIHRTYVDVPVGKTMALFGSHGGLEIAVRGGSAAQSWEIRRGDPVVVFTEDESEP
jgi:S-adenosyl-L-methionine hydrolase (adenosine-forming)